MTTSDTAADTAADSGFLSDLETGIIYRNPRAHLKSVHAYFPTIVPLGGDELLAVYVLGEAFEAANVRVHVSRSTDGGRNWTAEGPLAVEPAGEGYSEGAKACRIGDQVVVLLQRHQRADYPDQGLTNPDTMGFVPTQFLLTTSDDGGRTFADPWPVEPPLEGPEWELCTPVTPLSDGRWLLISSTWMDWSGALPNGHRMVAMVSTDQGRSWPDYLTVMHDPDQPVIFWESKIVEMPDGRLVAVAWVYDQGSESDRPNQFATSDDGGASWSSPASTGMTGQTMTPLVVGPDRLIVLYRRMDRPGLWALDVRLTGDGWNNVAEQPMWGFDAQALTTRQESMVQNFRELKFGAPSLVELDDGSIYVAFWCYENAVSVIRWFRFRVS